MTTCARYGSRFSNDPNIIRLLLETPTMSCSNFCANCGIRLTRKRWRAFAGARCDDCASRLGRSATKRLTIVSVIAIGAFAFGRYMRPGPPPLIIHRAVNSPLSDAPVDFEAVAKGAANNPTRSSALNNIETRDEAAYICGARTRKGTPCRRRVHAAGERCYQHKGMPAMVSLEKLTIKPDVPKK